MNYKICDIKNENSMKNASLTIYLLDDSPEMYIHERPAILICPGGGYAELSDREAEIIALQFTAMGYHAGVLRYSVAPAVFPTALLELGKSVALLREHAEEWKIDTDKIIVSGFSAGGHLAASYGMLWNQTWFRQVLNKLPEELCPNAMILCYPVITSGEFANEGSFRNLLGENYEEKKREVSLEFCVSKDTPRTFIWHTYEDEVVPVQNSLLLVNELVKQNIPVEFHMFEKGNHGLALANRMTQGAVVPEVEASAAEWIHLVRLWLEREFI